MHPRNLHQGRYDFVALCQTFPDLEIFLQPNPAGDQTIDFSDPSAVLCLNRALLAHYYGVAHWMIPAGYLCPPIPGRANYIHYLADLLGNEDDDSSVRVLDIGTGANGIYPIIGSQSYGWTFVATEIDPNAIKTVRAIVELNPCLTKHVRVVRQRDSDAIFRGIIRPSDHFDLTMCNPPFHESAKAAQAVNQRKVRNLGGRSAAKGNATLNFGGQSNELWCRGGEVAFISQMIEESVEFADQVNWFTSLVSQNEHLRVLKSALNRFDAKQVEVINMAQGNKVSRLLAWSFGAQGRIEHTS